jgi:hypothetical protein
MKKEIITAIICIMRYVISKTIGKILLLRKIKEGGKMKKEVIGTIKGIDLLIKSAPKAEISFRTGKYMSQKDRPRDKSYKRDYIQKGEWK